ncbi:MAG: sigma 54-interacting transcriptional regulator [Sandaracinaceae bacterium]
MSTREEGRELWLRGRLDEAAEVLDALIAAAEPAEAARLTRDLARVEMARESPRKALELFERALAHAGEADAPRQAATIHARRAEARAWFGQSPEASDEARSVLEDRAAPAEARSVARRTLGRVAATGGDVEEALRRFDEAIGELRQSEDAAEPLALAYLDAAEALLDRDGPVDSSAAAARLAEARDHIEGGGLDRLRPRLGVLLARARGANGDTDGAVQELERLVSELRSGPRDVSWQALAALARLHEQRGAEFLARKSFEQAVEVLEALATALAREHRESFWNDARRQYVRRRAAGEGDRRPRPQVAGPFADGRLARLLEILKRLASETDVDRVLERITDCAIELSGAERGFVLLTDEDDVLLPHTVRDVANPDDPHVAFSRSIAEAVLIDGEPILTVDARSDMRLSEYLSVHKLMLKSVACLPIRGRSGTVGVLYLEHRMRRGRFGEADLDLLLAFADQAAIALENARLLASLDTRREELERANEELGAAKEEIERLLDARTVELEEAKTELVRAREALRAANDRHGIVGRSERMRRVFAVIDRVRDAEVPVVIHGESGTGKELIARAIHFSGRRSRESFVALNCAAIPEALLESELFGHVRGAFTGADRDREGVIVKSSGGTLFLDEVGDMPAKMQVDLLRVLQDRKVRPVGGDHEVEVDIRVIAASNKSLERLVEHGEFREDLFYRLNVVQVKLPPLRERVEDIPLLCEHFLAAFAERDDAAPKRISREAIRRIASHPLPGNVRQLEHLLLNAWVMSEGDVIDLDDLALADDGTSLPVPPRLEKALSASAHSRPPTSGPADAPPPSSVEEFKDTEKRRILEALEAESWNRVRAAKALGMARRTFYRRLKEYDIL